MQTKVVFMLLLFLSFNGFSQDSWSLKKDKDSIKVYTRSKLNSNIKEFKAIATIDSSPDYILEKLLDAPKYCETCKPDITYYVKELDKNQHVFYTNQDLPWPVKDRDIVSLLTVKHVDSKTIRLTVESLPNELPKKDKTIRIQKLSGYWLLKDENGKTKVTREIFVDPEGSLPAFIVNSLLVKAPFEDFEKLRHAISEDD